MHRHLIVESSIHQNPFSTDCPAIDEEEEEETDCPQYVVYINCSLATNNTVSVISPSSSSTTNTMKCLTLGL